jgi:hypothetical protein
MKPQEKEKFIEAIETIIKDVLGRHHGKSFHNNRVKADLEEALRLLREIKQ